MNIFLEIGFRFLPPDEEIINFFLLNKMNGYDDRTRHIREVDLLKQDPWDLPALSIVQSTYPEWLFFYKLKKISNGKNERTTQNGFWRSTGQDRKISYGGRVIGNKKTLVFYKGRSPCGVKTDWIMHEYRATADFIPPKAENSYVVGYLRNTASENPENSISNDYQPSAHFAASSSQNNAAGITSMEDNSMDYEIALQTQMEDQGIFDYDLSPFNGSLDLPSSSTITINDQNKMEEECFTLEDLLPSNDLIHDEPNEWQRHFGTIEQEKDFMTSMFPNQDEYPFRADYRTPDYAECDHVVLMSDGTGHGHSEGFNQKRMENGFHHDDILIMDSSVDSATVTAYEAYEIDCLKLVREEKSVNSRTCKSQYEPTSHKPVVLGHPKRFQLQGKSLGKAVSKDKDYIWTETRESVVRGPVVELVRNKKSIVQSNQDPKMDRDRNTKSDLNSRSNGSDSAGSSRKKSFNFLEMSQLSCKPNQPLVYVGNVLLGVILFIAIVKELMFLR